MSTSTRANRQGTAPPAQPQRSTPPAPANPGCHTCANLSGMLKDSITREKATQDACNKAQAQTLRLQAEARHYASEKATLERLLAEKDTQIAVLTANNVRCLASPTPQSVTMSDQSPDARAPISRDSKKDERISNNDRHTMIRLFDYFSNDRPDLTSKDICLGIIRTLAPGWSKVEHKHIIQWKNDVKLGIDRFKKRSRDEETQAELEQQRQEWLAKIRLFLRPLLHENAIFSVTHATDYLSGKWPSSWGATPTRYAVYKAFKELNITVTRISASSLSAAEIDARIFMFRLELAFLCVKYNISPKMTLNIDESALRLIPTRQYAWCLNGIAGPSDLLRRFPLRRQYTTSTACVSMHGEKLAPMVNWKGTDRLKVPGFDGKVHQFAQESTHWNTTESFLAYVRDVVLPYCESKKPEAIADGYSGLFLLVIDCAPIHISKKTRSALGSLLKGKGMALFLPAGCTDKVQPLDIKCFGVVKPAARAEHLELLTETLEYRPLDERRKLLSTTAEVRHMALHSLAWGFAALHASTVREAWDVCTGVTQVVAGKVERVRGGWGVHSKELFDTASARFATEAGRRAERKYKVERAEQTGAPLERDPSLSSLMFRFGVPGIDDIECIEDVAEEAERDALGFDETRLQYVDDLPTGVNPDDGDERDDLKAFECVDEESDDDVEGGEISSALVTRTRMMDGGRN